MRHLIRLRASSARTACAIGACALLLGLASIALAGPPPEVKLTAFDGAAQDSFGWRVAVDGDVAVVGAPFDDAARGSAYVYVRCGGVWTLSKKLTASDGWADDQFGWSVSVSGDTAIIGGHQHNDGGLDTGAAYVFRRNAAGTWSEQQKLTASETVAEDRFGYGVAMSGDTAAISTLSAVYLFARGPTGTWSEQTKLVPSDGTAADGPDVSISLSGDTLAVGADGSVYVFTRSSAGTWSEQQKLTATGGSVDDAFGEFVDVAGDTLVIGARYDDAHGDLSGSAYVFERGQSGTWSLQQKLTASDATPGDEFGSAVAVSGDTVVIGAWLDHDAGGDSGSAYLFTRDAGGTWIEQHELIASDAADGDVLGISVAVSGDTVVAGARGRASSAGAAYVYSLATKLRGSDPAPDDRFGAGVAVSGNTAVVGASETDDDGNLSGSAYVFTRERSGVWTERQVLTASDTTSGDELGFAVAVSADTAVLGAYGDDDGGDEAGSAYVFTRAASGNWSEQQKLMASDPADADLFGFSVAVSGDTAVVGAPGDDDDGERSGAVHVFTRDGSGTWTEQRKLTASDAAEKDEFGAAVAIDGDTIVVGASGDDDGDTSSGSAYVFTRDVTGAWSEQPKLTAFDAAQSDSFGTSVSISGDTVVIGASGDESDGGSAYVFTRDVLGRWSLQDKLRASDAEADDEFGISVALSGDTLVVGAYRDDGSGGGGPESGAAYVFTRDAAGAWTQQRKLVAWDAAGGDHFGESVAVSGDTAVIAAHGDDDGGSNSGSAYVHAHLGADADVGIVTRTLPDSSVGAPYRAEIGSVGGARPHRFDIAQGTLPSPLTLDPDTGVLHGTCDGAGTTTFVVRATDPCGEVALQLFTVIVEPAPEITTTALPAATRGRPYSGQLASAGGLGAMTWSEGGPPVPGIALDATGALSGNPSAAGDYVLSARVTDAAGAEVDRALAVRVNEAPQFATTSPADTTTGRPSTWEFTLDGGTAPFTWSLASGSLPVEGVPDPATGRVSGDALAPGTYDFTLRVTDAHGAAAEQALTVRVNRHPLIDLANMPTAVGDRPFLTQLRTNFGTPPFAWSVVSGSLPEGLELDAATNSLVGTPLTLGPRNYRLRCEDAAGAVHERDYTLRVAPVADVSKGGLKEELPINLLNGRAPITRALELVEGTRLSVAVKFRADAPVHLSVANAQNSRPVAVARRKETRTGMRLSGIVIPATGRYLVRVTPLAPFEGSVRLSVKVKPPRVLRGTVTLADGEFPVATLGVLEGARVSVVVKRARGSDVVPGIHGVRVDGGAELLLESERRRRPKSARLVMQTPVSGGTLGVTFEALDGSSGDVDWVIRIRSPRRYVHSEPDLPSGWWTE